MYTVFIVTFVNELKQHNYKILIICDLRGVWDDMVIPSEYIKETDTILARYQYDPCQH